MRRAGSHQTELPAEESKQSPDGPQHVDGDSRTRTQRDSEGFWRTSGVSANSPRGKTNFVSATTTKDNSTTIHGVVTKDTDYLSSLVENKNISGHQAPEEPPRIQAPKKHEHFTPNTAEWVTQRLRDDALPRAVGILRTWMPNRREREATEEKVLDIRRLDKEGALEAVREMRHPRRFIRGTKGQDLKIRVTIENTGNGKQADATVLVDSGATGSCINKEFVERNQLEVKKLPLSLPVYNADGTLNNGGAITGFVEVRMIIGDHAEKIELAVVNLGKTDIFLGLDWLRNHNPSIDWDASTLVFDRCPDRCGYLAHIDSPEAEEEEPEEKLEEGERLFWMDWDKYVMTGVKVRAQTTSAADPYLAEFSDVFSKTDFDRLPDRRPWDHAIELTPGAKAVDCKVYPLSPVEQRALDEFLEENLRTGRIRGSISPMASPFFFVKKKDGSLRPVQDYRKLNEMTVKNRYPLPLIQELINKIKDAKHFTKMDVHWGYNNIRIKEGDEWKAAFRTNRGLFEPVVMFFGLTNSLATFQVFMNVILKELINEGHVIVYLDDILIFTDDLESH